MTRTLALFAMGLAVAPLARAAGEPAPLRFGFSAEAFVDVNETDTRAALKIWAQTLGSERGIPVDGLVEIYANTDAMKEALLSRKVDAVTMMTAQFWALRQVVPLGPIILGFVRGVETEEYVLLVHRDSPFAQPADLRGRSVNLLLGSRASLARPWLECTLLEGHLGPFGDFFGKISPVGKLTKAVLPVFFRQTDACVVTREGFRTMSELNPQVGRQLRVLMSSAPLVPVVFCFRGDLQSRYRDKLISEIQRVATSPAGRQTLALFQSEQLIARPISDLDDACALLDRHERLLTTLKGGNNVQLLDAAPPAGGERSQ